MRLQALMLVVASFGCAARSENRAKASLPVAAGSREDPEQARAIAARDESMAIRPRARDLGIICGNLPVGKHNAITDVSGVRVGQVTILEGDGIRTGVTAILPHAGDLFRVKVRAAFDDYNGFGKPFGVEQIRELGEIETPILLGPTLSVPRIADAVISYVLRSDESASIRSVNPVVGETNDGYLSDIRVRPIREEHVFQAIEQARGGAVDEGSVGAGTGTRCMGYKGGIGTSSRRLRVGNQNWTVGVLVQSNFGGRLRIGGLPIPLQVNGRRASARRAGSEEATGVGSTGEMREYGSCAMVVATDAPLTARQLRRLARRTFAGMARSGASFSHGSGDYTFAFSTRPASEASDFADRDLSAFFLAVADATEEAIYNSLLRATTVRGRDGHVARAISIEKLRVILSGEPGVPRKNASAGKSASD